METIYRFVKQIESIKVLILPMRNGNRSSLFVRLKYEWNRSYPTYEEWKPGSALSAYISAFCSYPTYEEWKPIQPFVGSPSIICSYPTYEEWKHSKHHIIIFP